MAKRKITTILDRYDQLLSENKRYKSIWDKISKYVGIRVNTEYAEGDDSTEGNQLDDLVNDPTAALSVMQAGDYLMGIMWGTGDNAITVEPSDALLEKASEESLTEWFKYMTSRTLFHMNHSKGGLNASLKAYNYDQSAFGTSGVGCFINKEFVGKKSESALTFREYGIDTIAIDEGNNRVIDVVFVTYNWRTHRIIEEFAIGPDGELDQKKFDKLPKDIQTDYNGNQWNNQHRIVHAIYPRKDFNPTLKGKKGTRYQGSWFSNEERNKIFYEEDYAVFPIPVARAIKIRGEIYGRASGTIIISTIMSVDYMVGETFQILEKMQDPALGTWNNALFGDNVLDSGAGSITVFNQELLGKKDNPLFKIGDTGDPTGIIQFLIPYLNEKVTTAFKLDVLLDFNAEGDRTATEMMQRAIIRGKNLAGMLQQQKVEMYDRLIDRAISLLWQVNEYGIDAKANPDIATKYKRLEKTERIIPEAVVECQKNGVQWYKIKYNGELSRLTNTEAIDKIMQLLNMITAIGGMFPAILEAVKWYDLFKDVNKHLGLSYFKSAEEFEEIMRRQAEKQQLIMAAELQKVGAGVEKDLGAAEKSKSEATKT